MKNDSDKIITKIKKVLELSKNNPSEKEAQSAALKAQKMMAEYHISLSEIEEVEDINNIVENKVNVGKGNKWKYFLAETIAKNFRCKHFFYGKGAVIFYGYEVDAEIASETFTFLYEAGIKMATSYYRKLRNRAIKRDKEFNGTGIKNCFLLGYLEGIKEELEKQCTALMIIVPQKVQNEYSNRIKDLKIVNYKMNISSCYADQSREEGRKVGKNIINSKNLKMETSEV